MLCYAIVGSAQLFGAQPRCVKPLDERSPLLTSLLHLLLILLTPPTPPSPLLSSSACLLLTSSAADLLG